MMKRPIPMRTRRVTQRRNMGLRALHRNRIRRAIQALLAVLLVVSCSPTPPPEGPDWIVEIVSCPDVVEPGATLASLFQASVKQTQPHPSDAVSVEFVLVEKPEYPSPAPLARPSPHYYDGVLFAMGTAPPSEGSGSTTLGPSSRTFIPDDIPLGTYYLGVVVDAGNHVIERDETNNVAFCPIQVEVQCPPGTMVLSDSGTLDNNRCVWDWRQDRYQMYATGDKRCDEHGNVVPNGLYFCPDPASAPWQEITVPPLEQLGLDYNPEDGWRLVKMDFGGYDRLPENIPFFALYNKYQSKVRVFFYPVNPIEGSTTDNIAVFFHPPDEGKTLLLNTGREVLYASDYLGRDALDIRMFASTHLAQNQWTYADFSVYYDPDTARMVNPRLRFPVNAVDIYHYTGEGKVHLTYDGTARTFSMEKSDPTEDLFEIVDKVQKSYSTADDLAEKIEKKLNETNEKTSAADWILGLLGISSGRIKSGLTPGGDFLLDNLGFFGGLAGLVEGIIGLFSEDDPTPSIAIEGGFHFEGTISTQYNRFEQQLRVPGTRPGREPENEILKPVYDRPLGVFALTTTPVLMTERGCAPCIPDGARVCYSCPREWSHVPINNLDYAINPESNMRLLELYAAIVYTGEWISFGKCPDCQLERLDPPPQDYDPGDTGKYDGCTGEFVDGPEIRVWRTPYVPFDRFVGAYLEPPGYTYFDCDGEQDMDHYPPPETHYIRVRVVGILERTDRTGPDGRPIIEVFSYLYEPYQTRIERSLEHVTDYIDQRDWEGRYSYETVGKAIDEYLTWEWFGPHQTFGGMIELYHPYYNWERNIGNLVVMHDRVDRSRPQGVFRRYDEKIFRFVQYKEIDGFLSNVHRYENGEWKPLPGLPFLRWTCRPYSGGLGQEELEYVTQTLDFDPEHAQYCITSDSRGLPSGNHMLDEPGRYRVVVQAFKGDPSEEGSWELLTREFEVIK